MKKVFFIVSSLLFCGSASATLWNVDSALGGQDSSGFRFSLLHNASSSSPMSGSIFADIISASGTFDDSNGDIDFLLGLDVDNDNLVDGTLKLSNLMEGDKMFFDNGLLDDDTAIKYALSGTTLTTVGTGGFLGFGIGKVCCSGDFAPNSFKDSGSGELHYLTLWGANIMGPGFVGSFDSTTSYGIDLRLAMSAVPVPAAVWLFGTALIGLFGLQRRKAVT